jgi:hypothetical protein
MTCAAAELDGALHDGRKQEVHDANGSQGKRLATPEGRFP